MTRRLMRELEQLRNTIREQGQLVNDQLDTALSALLTSDLVKADQVINRDADVDSQEVAIEEDCLKVIALHQPVGRDLRLLVTILKVNNDLERIADHAVNIAVIARKFAERGVRDFPPQIIRMGRLVTEAAQAAIDALLGENIDAALEICHDDKSINELCGLVYDEAKRILHEQRGSFGHVIRLYRVGRELERIGDLSKNIAEDTLYLITGEVVRHNRMRLLESETERMESENNAHGADSDY